MMYTAKENLQTKSPIEVKYHHLLCEMGYVLRFIKSWFFVMNKRIKENLT